MQRSRETGGSAAYPLAAVYLGLVAYASLYPFLGWRWPGQFSLEEVLTLPLPPWRERLDIVVNVLGYLPLGLLLFLVGMRRRLPPVGAWVLATALASGLSYLMEVTQQFLPGRYPSALDWMTNSIGAALGALFGWVLHHFAWLMRWQDWRDRWFSLRSGGALTLLLTWPLGLLFPAPFPFGVGPALGRVQDALLEAALNFAWTPAWLDLWADAVTAPHPLAPAAEMAGTALGLIGPVLLAYSVIRPGWRRGVMLLALGLAGVLTTTISVAVNFGPAHALAWWTPALPWSLAMAATVGLISLPLPERWSAALALVALGALMVLVAQAPADPFYASSLQAWEQGRFIHFHGFAQWIGWAWPLAAVGWLVWRVGWAQPWAPRQDRPQARRSRART